MISELSQKLSTVAVVEDNESTIEQSKVGDETFQFDCGQKNVNLQRSTVKNTTYLKLVACQEFILFINSMPVRYGKESNSGELTAKIRENDIIWFTCKHWSKTVRYKVVV